MTSVKSWTNTLLAIVAFASLSTHAEVRFDELNGVMWYYTTQRGYRFTQLQESLDDLKQRGIRVIGIYSPYHGDPDMWRGCDPLDFYATPPQNGSLDDFKAFVSAAHDRDMKVVSYFANIYIDTDSTFFKTAERQYAQGIRDAREVSAFRWSDSPTAATPQPAAGPSSWRYSAVAKTFYWSLWGEAGFDFTLPGARAEIERIGKFWLDTGLDGFMWDVGMNEAPFKYAMADLPKAYTATDKWLTFEVTEGSAGAAYDAFGMTSWFNHEDADDANDYSLLMTGRHTVDSLEQALRRSDFARSKGKTTFAWNLAPHASPLRESPGYAAMQVQEAALLAGAGLLYGHPDYESYMAWPESLRKEWDQVLATINAHKALLPSASRTRISVNNNTKAYALRRTSADGSQSALLLYNFAKVPATVQVDLTGTGIVLRQSPVDLYAGGHAPRISSAAYSVKLPAYGFKILAVATEAPRD